MRDYLTFHGLFFLYGSTGIINCLWALKTIPDNRGKSLVKVEEMYEEKINQEIRSVLEANLALFLDLQIFENRPFAMGPCTFSGFYIFALC